MIVFLLLLGVTFVAAAQPKLRIDLDKNSNWDLTLGVADLTGGAGTDFPNNIESDPAAQNVWVRNSTGNWRIDVSRSGGATWNDAIRVYVRRTSGGDAGVVSGGTAYQEVTTVDTTFFTGTGNPRYVAIQFMTNGGFGSLGVPAGTYTTTVTYTVTDNL